MNETENPFENLNLPQRVDVPITQAYELYSQAHHEHPLMDADKKTSWLQEQLQSKDICITASSEIAQGNDQIIGISFDQCCALGLVFNLHPMNIYRAHTPIYATVEPVEQSDQTPPIEVEIVPIITKSRNRNSIATTKSVSDALKLEGNDLRITEVYQKTQDINLDTLKRSK